MNKSNFENKVSRRKFIGMTIAASTLALTPADYFVRTDPKKDRQKKPDSNFGGVQIGVITYSWRSMPSHAEDILKYCLECGVSSVELMYNTIEWYAGLQRDTKDIRQWRMSVPMKKYEELGKMYNRVGVNIQIAKFVPENLSDEEIDYSFSAAKAMGAKGVSTEIGEFSCKKLGPFAEKHDMYVIMHNHGQPGKSGFAFEPFLEYSPKIMLNFDAGHYFGATGLHPNGIIEKLHDRIFSIHLKDKTGPKSSPRDSNMEWGKGETPITDILLLLKKKKWPIIADIELEYQIPEGSDAVAEVKKCVEYCKKVLL